MNYKYPKSFWVIAEEIADSRTTRNKINREKHKRFDRDKNFKYISI